MHSLRSGITPSLALPFGFRQRALDVVACAVHARQLAQMIVDLLLAHLLFNVRPFGGRL